VECTVQSIVKGLKRRKKKQNKGIRHMLFFSCIKNIKKYYDLRVLCISAKIYPRAFDLAATLDPKSNIYNIYNNIYNNIKLT